jgi:hypothetical protein
MLAPLERIYSTSVQDAGSIPVYGNMCFLLFSDGSKERKLNNLGLL